MRKKYLCSAGVIAILIAIATLILVNRQSSSPVAVFQKKAGLLYQQVRDFESPSDKCVVFLSVCNGEYRANVYEGVGRDIKSAWADAESKAVAFLETSELMPRWVKCDLVYTSEAITHDDVCFDLVESTSGFYRYGLAFDSDFQIALLEQELNYAELYNYDIGSFDLSFVNAYLSATGRQNLTEFPDDLIRFQCLGWICDDDNQVYELSHEGLSYGRRNVDNLDAAYATDLITGAAGYLRSQLQSDGKFIYGVYPSFDEEIDSYNILRHAGTIWSLIEYYQLTGDESVRVDIESAITYLLSQVVYRDENTAYVVDDVFDEIKLGACGLAVIALTQYMQAFDSDKYIDVCKQLGNGILTFMNQDTGAYVHVLDLEYELLDECRTVYYDGEATFGLCLLYDLTGDIKYLDVARKAADYFIVNDYDTIGDHWVSYAMVALTRFCPDIVEYYEFAFKNVWSTLESVIVKQVTTPIRMEALMATFDVYNRMLERGIAIPKWFDAGEFLQAISIRADRLLDGRCYPETVMYFSVPETVLDAHMVREDDYRIRIDDVQHVIGGFYQYAVNYDKLVECGF